MPLSITDMILILTVAGFAFTGFWFGFIHMIGSLVSLVVAVIISGQYFDFVAIKLSFLFAGHDNLGRIVVFILLFLIVTRLVGFIFWVLNKFFNLIAILPFLKTANRLGGAIIGFVEGVVLTSLVIFLIIRYPLSDYVIDAIAGSWVSMYLLDVAAEIAPLLPEVVQQARAVIGA